MRSCVPTPIAPTAYTALHSGGSCCQISVIARPQDWKKALQEIADADQLSPEYGGTGARREDLPSLADALLAAGSRAGAVKGDDKGKDKGGVVFGRGGLEDGARRHRGELPPQGAAAPCGSPTRERGLEEHKEEEEEEEDGAEEGFSSKGNGRRGWFGAGAGSGDEASSSWRPLGWIWSAWGGSGGATDGGGVHGDAEESIVTADEEVRMFRFSCSPRT